MRPHLKLQQELLLTFLVDKLTPPPSSGLNQGRTQLGIPQGSKGVGAGSTTSTSDMADREKEKEDEEDISRPPSRAGKGLAPAKGETRELMLEILGHLSRYPRFMVDIWVNYDCDLDCEDVFERLIGFLAKVTSCFCQGAGQKLTGPPRVFSKLIHSNEAHKFFVWIFCFPSSVIWLGVWNR